MSKLLTLVLWRLQRETLLRVASWPLTLENCGESCIQVSSRLLIWDGSSPRLKFSIILSNSSRLLNTGLAIMLNLSEVQFYGFLMVKKKLSCSETVGSTVSIDDSKIISLAVETERTNFVSLSHLDLPTVNLNRYDELAQCRSLTGNHLGGLIRIAKLHEINPR